MGRKEGSNLFESGTRLAWMAVARPRTALALLLAVVLAMAPGLLRLELRTDGHALVPPDDPAVAIDREARRTFGLRDPLLVVVETGDPRGIYNPGTLRRLERLTRKIAALPGLRPEDVQSLATEKAPRFAPGSYEFQPLLAPPLDSPRRLAEIREDVEGIDILHGTLVSFDRRAAAVLVGIPGPSDPEAEPVDRTALYHRIAGIAADEETAADRISVVGAPAAEALLGEHVLADLALMVPLALLVIAAVLWAACGRARAALLGLAKVGAAQVFTLGLMGWCGEPIYLTSAMIPVLLTTIGLADEIHLLWRYRHRPAHEPAADSIRRITAELARPIVLTSLTTAAGFLSFLTSSIRPVSRFGLYTAAGVLFCMVWSLAATPALLALRPDAIPPAGPRRRPFARPVLALVSRPRLALPALALATAALVLGIPRLFVQDSWIDNFARSSPLRQATERMDRRFAGTHALQVVLTFDTPEDRVPAIPAARGPLLAASAVAAVGRFEEGLRARPEVGGVFGLASHLSTTAYFWGGRREEARAIVDNPSWIYLHARRIGNVRGDKRRTELVDDGFRRTVVTVLLKGADFRRTQAVIDEVRRLEKTELAPAGARVELAGDLAISQAMIPAIVRTQTGSLLGALTANLLILTLLFRSFRLGLICAAPTSLAVAWTFGLMGWLGIPLGVATSVFCAVTLGIGDDHCIHLLERFQAARSGGAATRGGAARAAAAEAGPAILVDTLAITLGFGLMTLSRVPTNRWLGLLVLFGLAGACLLTLAGVGSVLGLRERQRSRRTLPDLQTAGEPR